jgi:hypothetical protein
MRKKQKVDSAELAKIANELDARCKGMCELELKTICVGAWGFGLHRHHRQPRRTGDNRLVNILMLCRACHDFAHAHPALAYRNGWLVHSWDDPAEVEVIRDF